MVICMKAIVCGSSSHLKELRKAQEFLSELGYEVIDQFDLNYTGKLFSPRDLEEIHSIVRHDISKVLEADIVFLLAENPSWGAAIEAMISKQLGKKVVLMLKKERRRELGSPWPFVISDEILEY